MRFAQRAASIAHCAADDRHRAALGNRGVITFAICLHQVMRVRYSCGIDAEEVFALYIHKARQAGA